MFSWIRSMGNLQIWTLTSLVFSRTKVEDRTFYLQSAHDFECSKLWASCTHVKPSMGLLHFLDFELTVVYGSARQRPTKLLPFYPRRHWTLNRAVKHCSGIDGDCLRQWREGNFRWRVAFSFRSPLTLPSSSATSSLWASGSSDARRARGSDVSFNSGLSWGPCVAFVTFYSLKSDRSSRTTRSWRPDRTRWAWRAGISRRTRGSCLANSAVGNAGLVEIIVD